MSSLEHAKNFYPDNYKLDLSETMKAALSKGSNMPSHVITPNIGNTSAVGGGVGGGGTAGGGGGGGGGTTLNASAHSDLASQSNSSGIPGMAYVTEKLYMLLQLYLQNKGWNPSAELMQCFTDLKDGAMLPSASCLQILANRLALDGQGRLILRENGKIVLPFEHFANAVMLKHMSGPHGLHLSAEATMRAVIESYTIGREHFGMEKEFIIDVVESCPSPACRYYKSQLSMAAMPFTDQQFAGANTAEFLQHLTHLPPPQQQQQTTQSQAHSTAAAAAAAAGTAVSNSAASEANANIDSINGNLSSSALANASGNSTSCLLFGNSSNDVSSKSLHNKQQQQPQYIAKAKSCMQTSLSQISTASAAAHQQIQTLQSSLAKPQQKQQQQQQQQFTAALIQQQNRALVQQNLEKFSNLGTLEKQRLLSQLDSKHFDPLALAAAAANLQIQGLLQSHAVTANAASAASATTNAAANAAAVHATGATGLAAQHQLQPTQSPHSSTITHSPMELLAQKHADGLRLSTDTLETNKDILALHNGAWTPVQESSSARNISVDAAAAAATSAVIMNNNNTSNNGNSLAGSNGIIGAGTATGSYNAEAMSVSQEKIVHIFSELMRNMARMKSYIRPSMCKPYGKQSETLQKTLIDTIQIVQTLRNYLPAPHIPITSWKSENDISVAGSNGNNCAALSITGGSGGASGGIIPSILSSLTASGSLQLSHNGSAKSISLQSARVDN